jgi:acyl-CoA synthetase (AMP-forming)/AMP-acid ligase II
MQMKEDVHTIRDLIDRQAEAQPDQGFLLSPETKRGVTFRQLQEQVRQLCGLFQTMGLAPGDQIAFLMDNGLFTAQLFLGTLYGGFVTVPLNVRAGVSQLSYTLENCDAKFVFVGRRYEALLKEVLGHVRRPVEVVWADADSGPAVSEAPAMSAALPTLRADDAAMLMYTSGSTGQPKGPIHTHRSILAHGRNSVQAHELTAADRSLLVLPLYHINAECVTLIPTLLSGGSVVLPHGFTVSEFWNWIDDYRCTWSAVVPTIISQLLDWKDPKAENRAAAFARIRFLRSSSAPLSPALHREFIDKFKLPLIQAMGSSEAGNVFSNPVPPRVNKVGSPGLPWGFEAKIVDRDGAELPAGEPGEVWLRGDGMMRGYYKDPTATAAALDGEGWLHTGDLAYRDADGYFFVVGRSKELIIKGGVNIAPKQIDEVLEAHPAVLEATAVGVPDRYVGEDLVAFAVLRDGMRCAELDLLSFCESHLGYFKTPTRVHFVADLPKGPSGKVQRLHLVEEAERLAAARTPPLKDETDATAMAKEAAWNEDGFPLEQLITDIWTDLLAAPEIRPDSNFFALGGQSLQAIQCLSHLRERTEILLSLGDFFENATVAELAAVMRQRWAQRRMQASDNRDQARDDLQPIPVRDASQPCLLSPAQERIWFMEQVKAGEPAYNEAEAVRLKGPLDVAAMERAFNIMVGRHEILRTTIEALDGKPTTIIHESFPLQFKKISLTHLESGRREAELAQLLIDEPRFPYRLEAEPAVRVTIVEMDGEDQAVILMMHHIICDSASLGLLWRELATLYEACVKGEPSPLPPLPIQYGDFAVWQRQPRQKEQFAEDIAFWKEKLSGAPSLLDQPTDRPRPPVFSFRGTKRQFAFDAALAADLRRLCRQHQTSLFTVFAAALNTVMHRYTNQDDILIGIPIAARERPELRPLIGFLVDTHVLRTDVSGDPTFRELMADVQENVANVYAHRSVPFDQVVSVLQPERNLSYSPLIQVVLNWRDRDDQPQFIGLTGLKVEPLLAQPKIAKFDLTLTLTDTGSEIYLEIEYNTDLFNEDRIERLVGHMNVMLNGVVANVEQRLSELPLLSASERHQLLYGWNATQAASPAQRSENYIV